MNRKASFNGVATVIMSLSEDEQSAVVDYPEAVKKFAGGLARRIIRNTFFVPLADQDVRQDLAEIAVKWRRLAAELGYTGPVIWKVKEGFTLKKHASKAGPCNKNFQYLQDWSLKNDESTNGLLAFWVPRLVTGSKSHTLDEQKAIYNGLVKLDTEIA